jgi:hypothetical protein
MGFEDAPGVELVVLLDSRHKGSLNSPLRAMVSASGFETRISECVTNSHKKPEREPVKKFLGSAELYLP